ncbi:baseplate J/gp47 family protein [Flavonifractor plautii]|nr:baseplate J/gp47 family protein [Flavonifractor plautii]
MGSAYNVEAGAIDRMYVNLTGLTDYQSEAAVAARTPRATPPCSPASGSGCSGPHQRQRLSIPAVGHGDPGVGNAKVVELPGGPGTVGVTLVDSNDRAPSEEIVEAVTAHIGEERPVGALVTVAAAREREVAVAAQVSLTGGAGAGAVQDAFRAALAGYLHTLIEGKYGTVYYKPADDQPYTLLYNRVLALLLNVEGVEDFASLTVNGGTADVTIQAGEIPVLGEVSVA